MFISPILKLFRPINIQEILGQRPCAAKPQVSRAYISYCVIKIIIYGINEILVSAEQYK